MHLCCSYASIIRGFQDSPNAWQYVILYRCCLEPKCLCCFRNLGIANQAVLNCIRSFVLLAMQIGFPGVIASWQLWFWIWPSVLVQNPRRGLRKPSSSLSSLYSKVDGPSHSTWCSVRWSRYVQACALWYIQWACSSPWHFGSRVCVISHIYYWSFAPSVMKVKL